MSAELREAVRQLRRNLTLEASLQERFLQRLQAHRAAILAFDTAELETSSAALARAGEGGGKLRRERLGLLQRIGGLLGIAPAGLRLSHIVETSGDRALGDLRQALSELCTRVDREARSVAMLNRSHAEAYAASLRILLGDDPLEACERRARGGVLVNREA